MVGYGMKEKKKETFNKDNNLTKCVTTLDLYFN